MDFFTHVHNVYLSEMNYESIQLDIPLAIFMIKLLSIKVDFSNFKYEGNFEEYMKSDKPLKLRYYLQIKFKEELTEATEIAKLEMDKETKYIESCFNNSNWEKPDLNSPIYLEPPSNRIKIDIYDKYFKDKTFDNGVQNNISKWMKPDVVNNSFNSQIKDLINNEIRKKYGQNPVHTKECMIKFMHRFKDRESVEKLLYSMRDVYILGLV